VFIADEPRIVRGVVEGDRERPSVQVTRLLTLEQAQLELARELYLLFHLNQRSPADMDTVGGILKKTPGHCPVIVTVKDAAGRRCLLKLGREFQINPATYLRDDLEALLGHGSVQLR
jgi:DNA polymerase III subunit alpha